MFIPLDEDYGYITLEAMAASKAVITLEDSGGPLEFVVPNETGFVCKTEPEAIAQVMDKIMSDKELAIKMGKSSRQHLDDMNITWDNVVKELTR